MNEKELARFLNDGEEQKKDLCDVSTAMKILTDYLDQNGYDTGIFLKTNGTWAFKTCNTITK